MKHKFTDLAAEHEKDKEYDVITSSPNYHEPMWSNRALLMHDHCFSATRFRDVLDVVTAATDGDAPEKWAENLFNREWGATDLLALTGSSFDRAVRIEMTNHYTFWIRVAIYTCRKARKQEYRCRVTRVNSDGYHATNECSKSPYRDAQRRQEIVAWVHRLGLNSRNYDQQGDHFLISWIAHKIDDYLMVEKLINGGMEEWAAIERFVPPNYKDGYDIIFRRHAKNYRDTNIASI